jgi:hypothetical protein
MESRGQTSREEDLTPALARKPITPEFVPTALVVGVVGKNSKLLELTENVT